MTDEEDDELAVVSLLDDEYAAEILRRTSEEPMSATDLTEHCDASEPTIYRRLDRLSDQDLVIERQEVDPQGHHYKTYAARLERVVIELDDGEFRTELFLREDPADQFTRLFDRLREP
jgi:DNA-binding transcriptional ArsR family regulator